MNVAMTNQGFVRTARPQFKPRYDNFIGGAFVPPAAGRYFENTSPVNGQVLCEIARSDAPDVARARAPSEPHRRPHAGPSAGDRRSGILGQW
jgi:aldehyde dehydrogenase